jgi:hypothetical protein
MSGRKTDASPSAGRAPRSGPGVDSRDRIVIGNGDIADDCLPANDIIVVVLRERSYGKQQNEQHCTYFLHWILILSVVLIFETRPGPIGPIAAARVKAIDMPLTKSGQV